MLNDDSISAVLHADAAAAGLPPADLLTSVRRRAARRQRRKAAAVGFSAVVVAGVAVTGALTIGGRQHTTVLKAAGSPPSVTPSVPAADPLCAIPSGTPPTRYLDWPCVTPADATTPSIVAKLVESVRANHPAIKDPQVRLLADTRGGTDSYYGPSATLIEEWDAASNGSVVVADGNGTVADPFHGGDESGYPDAGDPAMLHGSFSTDDGVQDVMLYARADIASVVLAHDGAVTSKPFTGGAAAISVKAGDITVMHPSFNYVGKDASGATVSTIPYDSIFLASGFPADPCVGITSGTCSSGQTGLPSTGVAAPVKAPPAPTTTPKPAPTCPAPSPTPASTTAGPTSAAVPSGCVVVAASTLPRAGTVAPTTVAPSASPTP